MDYIIDYYTSTRGFSSEVGSVDYYHWKKLKHFTKGNIILVRDSKDGSDYIIKLIENPQQIPENYKQQYASQKYMVKYQVVFKYDADKTKLRVPIKLRKEIINKYNNICQNCEDKFTKEWLEVDHIRQYSTEGGLSIEQNLLLLCKACHKEKTKEKKLDEQKALINAKSSPNVIK